MFFQLSKILWALTNPGNLLLIALGLGWVLLWTPWRRFGRALVGVAAVIGATLAVVPVAPGCGARSRTGSRRPPSCRPGSTG